MKKIKNLFETLNKKLDGDVPDAPVQPVSQSKTAPNEEQQGAAIDRLFELPLSPVVNVANKGLASLRNVVGKVKELGAREVEASSEEPARIEPEFTGTPNLTSPVVRQRKLSPELDEPRRTQPSVRTQSDVTPSSKSSASMRSPIVDTPQEARVERPTNLESLAKESKPVMHSVAAAQSSEFSSESQAKPKRRELPTIDLQQIQANLALGQRKLAAEGAKMPTKAKPVELPIIDASEIRSRLQEIHAKPKPVEYPKRTALPEARLTTQKTPASTGAAASPVKSNSLGVKPPLAPPVMISRRSVPEGIASQSLHDNNHSEIHALHSEHVRSEMGVSSSAVLIDDPVVSDVVSERKPLAAPVEIESDFYPLPEHEPQQHAPVQLTAAAPASVHARPSSFLRPEEFSASTAAVKPNSAWGECENGLCLPLDLLRPPIQAKQTVTQDELLERSILIEEKLTEFKVKVSVLDAYAGPVITRFEVEPAMGVRGAQVVNLAKDLARSLGVAAVRVVETIPGKTCMGLELPNPTRQMIRLSEILSAPEYQQQSSPITIALGKDITGVPVATDLAKTPHMLVAGTTGSGKSVGVNAMILSILFKATPDEVRFIMIDPKMLELSIYEGIPHLLAPVVTDMKLAANALNWCVGEMEKRYRLLSALGVRNLAGFNQKVADAAAKGRKLTNPFSLTPEDPEPLEHLPLIVVVVDEFADLMMVAGKKIEELIARLAQKARAAGIHLILATQRPSVDVITGLIKANIPTRLAFQVSSKVDSRTILDQMGAEALLGQGDMLFLPPGTGYPTRVHGAFVDDAEVHCVVEYLKQLGEPNYVEGVLYPVAGEDAASSGWSSASDGEESDPLYDEAVALVLKSRRASISGVQRQMRIGYNRAARLIEQMEAAGLVSPMESSGNRTVLAPPLAE